MEKTITVKGVEQLAAGNKNGKAWTMYKITDQEGTEYKIFEPLNLGAPYQISYTEEPRKPFVNKEGKKIEPKGVERFIKQSQIADAPPVKERMTLEQKVDILWKAHKASNGIVDF